MLFSPCLTLNVLCIFQQLWEDGCFTVDPPSSFLTLHFQSLILTGLTFFWGVGGGGEEALRPVLQYTLSSAIITHKTLPY